MTDLRVFIERVVERGRPRGRVFVLASEHISLPLEGDLLRLEPETSTGERGECPSSDTSGRRKRGLEGEVELTVPWPRAPPSVQPAPARDLSSLVPATIGEGSSRRLS